MTFPKQMSGSFSHVQCHNHIHSLTTKGSGFYNVTSQIEQWLTSVGAQDGQLTLFLRHTSCSLTINENTDPDVRLDLLECLDTLAPRTHTYRHHMEGPDDMPAHIKTMLTQSSLTIPVMNGRTALGTWQAIYLIEHRDNPHTRELTLSFLGNVVSAPSS